LFGRDYSSYNSEIARLVDRMPGDMPQLFKNPSYETAMALKRLLSTTSVVLVEPTLKNDALTNVRTFAELEEVVSAEERSSFSTRSAVDEHQWSYDALEASKGCNNQHSLDVVRCKGCQKVLLPQFFSQHHGKFLRSVLVKLSTVVINMLTC
jgi:hypothetical protein